MCSAHCPRCSFKQTLFHFVEGAVPAALVAVARVGSSKNCSCVNVNSVPSPSGLTSTVTKRFSLGRRLPGPGENHLFVGDDFAIDAADFEVFAVRLAHHPVIAAAAAAHRIRRQHPDVAGAHPVLYFFRVDPRREDLGGRRFEPPLEGEARFGGCLVDITSSSFQIGGKAGQPLGPELFVTIEPLERFAHRLGVEPAGDGASGLVRATRPASDSTSRCFITAGNDICERCGKFAHRQVGRTGEPHHQRAARRIGQRRESPVERVG